MKKLDTQKIFYPNSLFGLYNWNNNNNSNNTALRQNTCHSLIHAHSHAQTHTLVRTHPCSLDVFWQTLFHVLVM